MPSRYYFLLLWALLLCAIGLSQKTWGFDWISLPPYPWPAEDRVQEQGTVSPPDPGQAQKGGPLYGESLKSFFRALDEADRRVVRVLFSGDSQLWGDNITGRLREEFQQKYGDGGIGLLELSRDPARAKTGHEVKSARGFHLQSIPYEWFDRKTLPDVGFAGRSFQSSKEAYFEQRDLSGEFFQKAEVLLRPVQRKADIVLAINGKESPQRVEQCQGVAFALNESRFQLGVKGDPVLLDGVLLEKNTGVSLSSIVHMGLHGSWQTAIPPANLSCGLTWLKPDLIILHYGINESASLGSRYRGFTATRYEQELKEWLTGLKHASGGTPILLFGMLEYTRGGKEPAYHAEVRNIQARVAEELGLGYFDTYGALGGEGQVERLRARRLLQGDNLHLTMGGGDLLARTFFEAIENAKAERPVSAVREIESHDEANSAIHFHSYSYAIFLGIVFLLSSVLLRWPTLRLLFLLLASYYFYASWKLWPLAIIVFSTLVDYLACLGIERTRQRGGSGRFYLLFSLFSNLGLLFSFKYLDFAIGSLNTILSSWQIEPLPLLGLLLPVGISFYTFQTLSYTIDVYRRQIPVERSLFRFAFYVAFFPQLVAGPIVRAREFLPDLRADLSHFTVGDAEFFTGLTLIFRGLFKKVMADFLALQLVDRFFDQPTMYTSIEGILAIYAYGLQIYGDFSGYTDIAIGSAMLLGFRLTENFQRPYQSVSVTEFWRRWHISLGAWLRDYLYISLGGSRQRLYFNLLVTMVLGGLWHGASWNFVLWGAYHGLLLVLERKLKLDLLEGYRALRMLVVLHLVLLGWLLFRVQDLSQLNQIVGIIGQLDMRLPNTGWAAPLAMVIWYLQHVTPARYREYLEAWLVDLPVILKALFASGALILLHQFAVQEGRPYIYFQF